METEQRELSDRELRDRTRFLEDIRCGVGPLNAAVARGWSPRQLDAKMREPEFAELVSVARERKFETLEETMFHMAKDGHFQALKMSLLQRPDRWRDIKHVQIDQQGTLDVGVVLSVKQAAMELIREGGVAALQPGGVLDVESIEVTRGDG